MEVLLSLLTSLITPSSLFATFSIFVTFIVMKPAFVQFAARLVLYAFWVFFCCFYGIIRGLIFQADRPDLNYYAFRLFSLVTPFLGITVTVTGTEHLENRPCVYMLNHQSILDMVALAKIFPHNTILIGKKSLAYIPLLGLYIVLAKNIILNRENHESAMKSMEKAGAEIRQRKAGVVIFPEGTRSMLNGQLLPFKKGGFNLAVGGQVPIIPIVISNLQSVYDAKRWRFPGGEIKVKILPPVSTEGKTRADVIALADQVRDLMQKELVPITDSKE